MCAAVLTVSSLTPQMQYQPSACVTSRLPPPPHTHTHTHTFKHILVRGNHMRSPVLRGKHQPSVCVTSSPPRHTNTHIHSRSHTDTHTHIHAVPTLQGTDHMTTRGPCGVVALSPPKKAPQRQNRVINREEARKRTRPGMLIVFSFW